MPLRIGRFVAGVILAISSGCGSDEESTSPSGVPGPMSWLDHWPEPRPLDAQGPLRLLDRLEEFDVDFGEDVQSSPALLFDERLGEPLDPAWVDGRTWRKQGGGIGAYCLPVEDPTDGGPVLALLPRALGLHRRLDLDGAFAVRVHVRWKPVDSDRPLPPSLLLTPFDPQALPSAKGSPRIGVRAALGDLQPTWRTTSLSWRPRSGDSSVRLSLFAGSGVLLDRVRVETLDSFQSHSDDAPRTLSSLRGAPRVHSSQVESMVLPAESRWSLELDVPAEAPRIDSWLSFAGGPGGLSVRAMVGDQLLAQRQRSFDSPRITAGFQPFSIDLSEHAGDSISLRLEVEGDASMTALWGAPELLGRPARPAPAVIVLSLDTLRPDVLGAYGGRLADLAPNLDRLARQGVVFEDAVSTSSYTLPSHASLFTGQNPLAHRTYSHGHRLNPQRSFLLADALRSQGWTTAAFTAGGNLDPHYGFAQGFDYYDVADPGGVPARFGGWSQPREDWFPTLAHQQATREPALDWLRRHRDQPFFLFLHTYFIHNYVVEARYLERLGFPSEGADEEDLRALWRAALAQDPAALQRMHQRYLASIAQIDERLVGPLLETLEDPALRDRTTLIVLSDHGEEFGEHGGLGHGRALWSELVRVPLLVRGPGYPAGLRWPRRVSLTDIAPTVARDAGLPFDPRWTGRPLDAHGEMPSLLHFVNRRGTTRWEGWIESPWKLLRRTKDGEVQTQLFSVSEDRDDRNDLAGRYPEAVEQLQRRLDTTLGLSRELAARAAVDDGLQLSDSALEAHLAALGYTDDEDTGQEGTGQESAGQEGANQRNPDGAPQPDASEGEEEPPPGQDEGEEADSGGDGPD